MSKAVVSEPKTHALLGASSSHMWLVCTPSARMCEDMPDVKSSHAAEGSLAHEICELKLRKAYIEPMSARTFTTRLNKLKKEDLYKNEMLACSDTYVDYIDNIMLSYPTSPYIAVERKVDFSQYVPEGFGTADCVIIYGDTLHIIDYKHGQGVQVSAEHNSQMMLYALGALSFYAMLYDIKRVKLAIVQPRLNNISEWELTTDELIAWGNDYVKPRAQAAYEGKGECVSGEHCRFCRAKAICKARANANLALAKHAFAEPLTLSNDEIGDILQQAQDLKKWADDVKDYALSEVLKGNSIPGWKAVEGRSVRVFKDTDKAFTVLKENGIDESMLYERVPLTLAKIETMLGKSTFAELMTEQIVKSPGKPTIVPESDKREPYTVTSAQQVFSNN